MSPGRLGGALLLVLGGAAAGWSRRGELKSRQRLLAELLAALGILREEIRQLARPLPAVFEELAADCAPPLGEFFAILARDTGTVPLSQLWREAVARLPLEGECARLLESLGGCLGRYDAESQAAEIDLLRLRLEKLLEEQRRECEGKGRLYPGLGASLGAMLAVILF